jgi:hypothetical protein
MKDVPGQNRPKYKPVWDAAVNKFTAEFIQDFCFPNGAIDSEKLTTLGSSIKIAKQKLQRVKARRR